MSGWSERIRAARATGPRAWQRVRAGGAKARRLRRGAEGAAAWRAAHYFWLGFIGGIAGFSIVSFASGLSRVALLTLAAAVLLLLLKQRTWLARNYSLLIFVVVAIICIAALALGLWRVPLLVDGLLNELVDSTKANNDGETRRIVFALAAVLAIITIFGTLWAQAIRVWVNERTARTAEANLTTGLINTAVEGLGAEKTVSRIGRPVTLSPGTPAADTVIEWQGEALPDDGRSREPGAWQTFEFTAPNLEVRIGAILTLERMARENPREHIRVMDILCAYIRENAPARDAPDHGLGDWPTYPENPSADDLKQHNMQVAKRKAALRSWVDRLRPFRTDLQVALEVLGRRPDGRKAREEATGTRAGEIGYRLDLRNTNLRRSDLSTLDFRRADLRGARLEGADLGGVRLEWAKLRGARLDRARLFMALLERADLSGAWLEEADLRAAQLTGTDLRAARLEAAVLTAARLDAAHLDDARLEAAILYNASLEATDLLGARLADADLSIAVLEGSDLRNVDFRGSVWAGASVAATLAQSADFRGAQSLTQVQLDQMIGDDRTLLPNDKAPDTDESFYIWSCWEAPPLGFDRIHTAADRYAVDANPTRFLCGPDNPRRKTGTPLALDAPYPEGHPLAFRNQ